MALPAIVILLIRMLVGWMGCGLLTKLKWFGPFLVALNPLSWIFIFKPIGMIFRWVLLGLGILFWMFVPGVNKVTKDKKTGKRLLKSLIASYVTTTVIILVLTMLLWRVAQRVVCEVAG